MFANRPLSHDTLPRGKEDLAVGPRVSLFIAVGLAAASIPFELEHAEGAEKAAESATAVATSGHERRGAFILLGRPTGLVCFADGSPTRRPRQARRGGSAGGSSPIKMRSLRPRGSATSRRQGRLRRRRLRTTTSPTRPASTASSRPGPLSAGAAAHPPDPVAPGPVVVPTPIPMPTPPLFPPQGGHGSGTGGHAGAFTDCVTW